MASRIRPSPALAALLSLVWPGLGQAVRGDRQWALFLALPPLVVVGTLAAAAVAVGPAVLVAHLLLPVNAVAAGGLLVVLALWWAAAIIHAARPPTPASLVTSVAALALVALAFGWAGSVVVALYRAGETIAAPVGQATPPPPIGASPGASPPAASPRPTPSPALDAQQRVTILFLGADAGSGAEGVLTDTIQVASFDPRTDQLVMISLPRDTGQLPLYLGGTWEGKINALMAHAAAHPEQFPDGGIGTLMRQVEYIIGIPIDYYAAVDFRGFVRLVDMVGGVDVVLDRPVRDSSYQVNPETRGFFMDPGEHHLDGPTALIYVRSRHGPGNSDFQRARRQQQVLLALRHKIDEPAVLANLPALIDTAAEMVRTDVPLDRLPQIVALLQQSTSAEPETYVLQPRRYAEVVPRAESGGQYMTRLRMDAVAELSISLFVEESRYAGAGGE